MILNDHPLIDRALICYFAFINIQYKVCQYCTFYKRCTAGIFSGKCIQYILQFLFYGSMMDDLMKRCIFCTHHFFAIFNTRKNNGSDKFVVMTRNNNILYKPIPCCNKLWSPRRRLAGRS